MGPFIQDDKKGKNDKININTRSKARK